MGRAEAVGLGVSVVGHVALLALLSLALVTATNHPITPPAMEVSFVDEVGATSAAPQPSQAPAAQARAPDIGPVEDAAPAPAPQAPTPPVQRDAVPAPSPVPAPRPPSHAQPRPAPPAATAGTGQTTRRPGLGDLDPRAFGRDPASHTNNPPAAVMSAAALSDIQSAIRRQIQPCADRQVDPGPGASRIQVTVNLRLNRDGSLASRPTAVRTRGVDDDNGRYESRVRDLAVAAYIGCSPLRGLPPDLYQTASGGWSNINLTYKLPD